MGGLARPDGSWQPKVLDLRDEEETRNSPGKNYLTFPRTVVKEPVLSLMAEQFDLVFNIRGAPVIAEMGLVAFEIDGAQTDGTRQSGRLAQRKGSNGRANREKRDRVVY